MEQTEYQEQLFHLQFGLYSKPSFSLEFQPKAGIVDLNFLWFDIFITWR